MIRRVFSALLLALLFAAPSPAALTHQWRMNSGGTLDDEAGTNDLVNPGGSANPTWLPTGGANGTGAYQFDGVQQYFQFTSTPVSLGAWNNDWTASFWIQTTDAGAAGNVYDLKVPVFGDPSGGTIAFVLGLQNGLPGIVHYDSAWYKEVGSTFVADGIGHYVTFVHHGTGGGAGTIDAYVDGVLDPMTINAHDTGVTTNSYDFTRIGLSLSATPYANMVLDSVLVWNEALSAAEIFARFGPEAAALPVPEPATFTLVALGAVALARRVRRNQRR